MYRSSLTGESVAVEAEQAVKEEGRDAKGIVEDPRGAVKKAEQKV